MMKLNVMDIPEEGMSLEVEAPAGKGERWFEELVKASFEKDYPQGNKAKLVLRLVRIGDNIQISGLAEININPECDRCLVSFPKHLTETLSVNLAPHSRTPFERGVRGGKGGMEEAGLDENGVAFSFYEGEEIDLAEIVREIIVLDIPIRYLCSEDCKGLCTSCGQNLNEKTCSCQIKPLDPRFAALKQFKL